jgi:hypothetical protein
MPAEGEVLLHAGGEVDGCSVGLRVFGDDLDPDTVSAMLGAKPTSACRKGDVHRGKHYDRVEKQGKWLLNTGHVRGVPLDDLIIRLLDRLTNDLAVWRELCRRFRVDLFCGLHLELWNRGLVLSPRTLQRVAERGLLLGLDIYFVGDDEAPGAAPELGG